MKRWALVLTTILILGYGLEAAQPDRNTEAKLDGRPPVGLDLEFVEGIHSPIPVIAGGTFYVDSITLRTMVEGTRGNILDLLRKRSAFRDLDWTDLKLERWDLVENPGGPINMEEFYQGAGWMGGTQRFTLAVRDAVGNLLAELVEIESTPEWPAPPSEAFATRRFSALVFGHAIVVPALLDGRYSAEGWVQLRNGVPGNRTFVIPPDADRLEVHWN